MPSIPEIMPGFLELGEWTSLHIRPLFDLFRDEYVAPALALIIFGTALVLCLLFVLDSTFIRLQVRRRIHAVKRIKTKPEFADQLAQVEKLMLGSRYLRHSWQKFRETLIEPSAENDGRGARVVLNTARPQNYFNTAEAGLRFPLYRAMPNLLVGIGLLLTFFGLVTALFFTTVAIKSAADLTVSQNALRDLLYAASFKFYTSIAGLAGSIILTLVLRYGTSAIEKSFDVLAPTLESKLVFVTPESIAFERRFQEVDDSLGAILDRIIRSVQDNLEALRGFVEQVDEKLSGAVDKLGGGIDELGEFAQSMEQLTARLTLASLREIPCLILLGSPGTK